MLSHSIDLLSVTEQLDDACRRVAVGRETARELAELVSVYGLKEVEFRLLWSLRTENAQFDQTQFDQTQLAELLSCSPAQVSTIVEHLSHQGHIVGQPARGDRRRNLWQITTLGRDLLEKIVAQISSKSQRSPLRVHLPRRNSA